MGRDYVKNNIKNIVNIMSDIEYGFMDEAGSNIIYNQDKWDNEFDKFYYLQTPEELLNSKCGVCWDQVELERFLFDKYGIPNYSFFIFIRDGDSLPSHTFLVYEDNNKYYWFEHSWAKYRGIHEYNNINELLDSIIDKFEKDHKEVSSNAKLYLYKYNSPKKHIKCNEFYKYIETQELIKNK